MVSLVPSLAQRLQVGALRPVIRRKHKLVTRDAEGNVLKTIAPGEVFTLEQSEVFSEDTSQLTVTLRRSVLWTGRELHFLQPLKKNP